MPKYDMYQFDQGTWVVTVEYPHQTLEYCVCSEYQGQQSSPHSRAAEIVRVLNKMEKDMTKHPETKVGLTRDQIRDFIDNDGDLCPLCKDGDVNYEAKTFEEWGASQPCSCNNCGARWEIIFSLHINDCVLKS